MAESALARKMGEVLRILNREYPEAKCSLDFETPFQLLVATILSAQCTDERVNLVTPALFVKFPNAHAMAKAKLSELEKQVRSTGFYRSKAKSISETSKRLVTEWKGEVPRDLESLVKLRGVGRKTANVILGNAYGIPGFPVDTHVGRLTRRIGFTHHSDPVKIEFAMHQLLPELDRTLASLLFIFHGRKVCTARKPACEVCPIAQFCDQVGVVG